jgi:hypothetical protein
MMSNPILPVAQLFFAIRLPNALQIIICLPKKYIAGAAAKLRTMISSERYNFTGSTQLPLILRH